MSGQQINQVFRKFHPNCGEDTDECTIFQIHKTPHKSFDRVDEHSQAHCLKENDDQSVSEPDD